MTNFLAPLLPEYTIEIPTSIAAIITWFIWLIMLLFFTFRISKRDLEFSKKKLIWLASLSVLILIFTPFMGFLPDLAQPLPIENPPIQHLMIFSAVPMFLAGGMVGTLPAVLLGGISGIFLAYLDTHNIFTPLIFMSLALVFSWCVRQRYRTSFFRLLRFPLLAAFFSLCLILPCLFLATFLSVPGEIFTRIAYTAHHFPPMLFSLGGIAIIAGGVCVLVGVIFNKTWGLRTPLQPAPGERNLLFRYLATTVPLLIICLIVSLAINWRIGENLARRSAIEGMTRASDSAVDSLSLFVDMGSDYLEKIGNENRLISGPTADNMLQLAEALTESAFFEGLALIDLNGEVITHFPESIRIEDEVASKIKPYLDLMLAEDAPKIFTLPSEQADQMPKVGFLQIVKDAQGLSVGFMWGQTNLSKNRVARPAIMVLDRFSEDGGYAQIVDGQGIILYRTNSSDLMPTLTQASHDTPTFIEEVAFDETKNISYYQPVGDANLVVVTSYPAIMLQEFAWQSTLPLMLVSVIVIVGVVLLAVLGLVPISKDIHQVAIAAENVTSGNLEINLAKSFSQGETGQLISKMDAMIGTLRTRYQNPLDLVSVSEDLDDEAQLKNAVQPVMQAVIMHGVSNVRMILLNEAAVLNGDQSWYRFGLGEQAEDFAPLDQEIMTRARRIGPTILKGSQIEKALHRVDGIPNPESILVLPLAWEQNWLGNLWVTYHESKRPTQKDVASLTQFAEKASTIVVHMRNLRKSLTSKTQMETLLDLLPEAVIITDNNSRIVYHNEAAHAMFRLDEKNLKGVKVSNLLKDEVLKDVLERGKNTLQLEEVRTEAGDVYHIITTPLSLNDRMQGQGTILRDITQERQQDTRKTDFVTTVSHELRSPLTLIHGYGKILRLTGNLNEQQDIYIRKIIDGVEEMQVLVQNLLDLGRLESEDALEISRVSVQKLTQKVVDGMDTQAKQKNIQMHTTFPEEPIYIEADATFLTQALKNIIENAIKFTNMGGSVTIGAHESDENIVFRVKDTGIGIAPLDQRHIFEKFQQSAKQAEGGRQGSGLGLAIVKTIADHHGGKVWFESQLGKGSTFYLQIPKKPSAI
jgi:PAS domain S-box-containing protein